MANVYRNNLWDERWTREVVKPFHELGIEANLWGCEILEQTLFRHPEIKEAFFGSGNRTLLYPAETYSLLRHSIPGVTFDELQFTGRCEEMDRLSSFLESADQRVAFVTGAHGVGKTRVMYECFAKAAEGRRVYWGLADSMQKSDGWFASVVRPG